MASHTVVCGAIFAFTEVKLVNIRTSFLSGRLTVYLAGELDHHEARCTIREIDELLDEYLPRDCVLDLNGLSFMDSSGIAVVMRAQRRMRALDGGAVSELEISTVSGTLTIKASPSGSN